MGIYRVWAFGGRFSGYVTVYWLEVLGDRACGSVRWQVLLGISLYSNATGRDSIMESLITKGLRNRYTMAFLHEAPLPPVFPEIYLLQVMEWKLISIILRVVTFFPSPSWLILMSSN